ncbi:hypothetical protein [Serratia marcescens]
MRNSHVARLYGIQLRRLFKWKKLYVVAHPLYHR